MTTTDLPHRSAARNANGTRLRRRKKNSSVELIALLNNNNNNNSDLAWTDLPALVRVLVEGEEEGVEGFTGANRPVAIIGVGVQAPSAAAVEASVTTRC